MAQSSLIIFLITPLLVFGLRILALKLGLVDTPDIRKIHTKPIPLIGGVVLVITSGLALVLLDGVVEFAVYLYLSACLVAFLGLLDDVFDLSALVRFVGQITASLFIILLTKTQLHSFGFLLLPYWDVQLGWLSIPITVFGVVGVINALNMADGIDGLAVMTFFLPVLTLALLSLGIGLSNWLLLVLISAAIFVVFNKTQSLKVFLGDGGSMFLGFLLAWLLVYFSQPPVAIIKPVTALYLVALPIYDTIFVMLRRFMRGVSPFVPDKTHLHHLLLFRGLSQNKALLFILVMQAFMIVLGVFVVNHWQEYIQFYLFIFLSAMYYFTLKKMWKNTSQP